MKKLVAVLLAILLVLTGCSQGNESSGKNELVVWTFTDEIETMINDYYLPQHPDLDYEIKVVIIPDDQYQTKLDPVLGTNDAPDVIALESASAKKYIESGMLADLTEAGIQESDFADTSEYVESIGRSQDGVLRALAWQATPGAYYYRASLAEKYLGVTSPEEMQEKVKDFDAFLATAKELKDASEGSVYMLSSTNDIAKPFYANRDSGWVKDGKLVIDDALIDLLELARTMVEEGYTMDVEGQSEAWFAGMSGDEIFSYFLPTWAFHYWLKPNSTATDDSHTTEGDWRIVEGPTPWFWGGTWVGIADNSEMKEAAADLIRFITTDPSFLESWAKDTGDFVSNTSVVEKIKGEFAEDMLGGQNHYELFEDATENINGEILTEYDLTIEEIFLDNVLGPYSKGEKELDEVISEFKDLVQDAYPDLIVE